MTIPLQGVTIAIALGLGVIAAAAALIHSAYQSHKAKQNYHQSSSNRGSRSAPNVQRNLTCPFCGTFVAISDRQLPCGHKCHNPCYQKRTAEGKKLCTFCRQDEEDKQEKPAQSNRRPSQPSESCSRPSQESDNIRSRPSIQSENSESSNSPQNFKCIWCSMPMESNCKQITAKCGHLSHEKCYTQLSKLLKCRICSVEKFTTAQKKQ